MNADMARPAGLRWWMWAAILILSDAMISYFARVLTGSGLRVNALLPVLILLAVSTGGLRRAVPHGGYLVFLLLGYGGFLVGMLTFGEPTLNRFVTISSGFGAFVVGYGLATYMREGRAGNWANVFFVIGCCYAIVCALAVFRVAPAIFPLIDTWHFKDGLPVARPEVMTDQNFQVFYLLPCVLPLVQGLRGMKATVSFLSSLVAIIVLAQLQTRSGAIIFGMALALALIAGYRRSGFRLSLGLVGLLGGVVAAALGAATVVGVLQPLIDRFTTDDFSTFHGRLWSASYLFEHVLDPAWWIPRGNEEFGQLAGGEVVPHFNGTAFFLEGGILGLACWLAVQIVPALRMGLGFAARRLSKDFDAIFVLGGATVAASLTLNVPYVEVVWIGCGAMVAGLHGHSEAPSYSQHSDMPSRDATVPLPMPGNLMP